MDQNFREKYERLPPEQQDELARHMAARVRHRLELLRWTRSSRAWQYIFPVLTAGIFIAFFNYPSARPWALLIGVVAILALVGAINMRLDAITELLERDLRRATEEGVEAH